jgi:hypothetical protein
MTPKEKAVELYNKYEQLGKDFTRGVSMAEFAKQCALIAVREIEDAIDFDWMEVQNLESQHRYWEKVKEEIKKL